MTEDRQRTRDRHIRFITLETSKNTPIEEIEESLRRRGVDPDEMDSLFAESRRLSADPYVDDDFQPTEAWAGGPDGSADAGIRGELRYTKLVIEAEELIETGVPQSEWESRLVEKGATPEEVEKIMRDANHELSRPRRGFLWGIFIGLPMAAIGVGWLAYLASREASYYIYQEQYWLAIVMVVFGGLAFVFSVLSAMFFIVEIPLKVLRGIRNLVLGGSGESTA